MDGHSGACAPLMSLAWPGRVGSSRALDAVAHVVLSRWHGFGPCQLLVLLTSCSVLTSWAVLSKDALSHPSATGLSLLVGRE